MRMRSADVQAEYSGSRAHVSFWQQPQWGAPAETASGETRKELAALWLSLSGFWAQEASVAKMTSEY